MRGVCGHTCRAIPAKGSFYPSDGTASYGAPWPGGWRLAIVTPLDWRGTLPVAIGPVLGLTRTLIWQSKQPVVALVTTTYEMDVKMVQDAPQPVAAQLKRLPGLGKWLVDTVPYFLAKCIDPLHRLSSTRERG
jgi:hypothetical protein